MKISAPGLEFELRAATAADVPLLLDFIRSMAEFEKLQVTATEELLREALFSEPPAAQVLLAFVEGRPAAYVVYFFTFSTMVGKRGLWLEDVFVKPEYRSKGIGKAVMAYLAEVARKNHCGRFEWTVLDWNKPALDFYRGLGATLLEDWRICRLEGASLERVAGLRTSTPTNR